MKLTNKYLSFSPSIIIIILILILILILITPLKSSAQRKVDIEKLRSKYALQENRAKLNHNIEEQIKNLSSHENSVIGELELVNFLDDFDLYPILSEKTQTVFRKAIERIEVYSISSQRKLLRSVMGYYPQEFNNEFEMLFINTSDIQIYLISLFALHHEGSLIIDKNKIAEEIETRFPEQELPVNHELLNYYLESEKLYTPNLIEFFTHPFMENSTIIYSLHRKNRNYPGLTIIKNTSGKFLRNADSTIFSVPQLALSISNLPGFMNQGNTPQGIFSIVGFYVSPTESIGPSPIVLTRIPFEVSTEIFYHSKQKTTNWRFEDYINLLPESWKNYAPIHEAFYAGKNGRRKIVMHGSTDEIAFFTEKPFYPLTPTHGCISAKEIWDPKTGKLIESDQSKLMNAFFSTNNLKGFLVVVDIDDSQRSVQIEDVLNFIQEAENKITE